MKKYQLLVLIICVALLSMSATLLFYSFYKIKHVEVIPMDIKVGDHIGMTVDADALHFGIVMVTGCSTRSIIITHKYDYPIKAIIGIVGELESWTSIKENDFILNKNEEKEVEFKVCAPKDATRDTSYTSTARIVLKRV